MMIHSHRDRRLAFAQEQERLKREKNQRNKESLDALEKIWKEFRDTKQEVIHRAHRGTIVDVNHIEFGDEYFEAGEFVPPSGS